MTIDRRTFMATMGLAVLAMRSSRTASIPRLGVQLYTVRSLLEKDFDGTLASVAAIGYTEVEFAGYFKRTPEQVRDALKRHKLSPTPGNGSRRPTTAPATSPSAQASSSLTTITTSSSRRAPTRPASCRTTSSSNRAIPRL